MNKKLFLKIIFLILFLNTNFLFSKYLNSKTCNECHPKIYEEHKTSMHHNSAIYYDELHTKMKEKVSPRKYSCALCHTPAVKNLRNLMKGKFQPNEFDERLKDGVSCFYCHQISKVMYTKHKAINFSSYTGKGKVTFFGNLEDAEDSNRHKSSSQNKIFSNNQVCMGCHAYKINKNDIQLCSTLDEKGKTSDCLSCHMPKKKGAPTKLNAKARTKHTSHKFLGIHSKQMVKQAIELKLKQLDKKSFQVHIKNKMGHSIITHPMRLKFIKTEVLRKGNLVWSNFKQSPYEDKEATFAIIFKDKNDKPTFPAYAKGYKYNTNLKAQKSKNIIYTVEDLQKDDIVTSTWISYIVSPKIAQKLQVEDKKIQKAIIGQIVSLKIE